MTARKSAVLVLFAISVASTNISAADPASEVSASVPTAFNWSDLSDDALPRGDGRSHSVDPSVRTNHDDTWRKGILDRLDASIAQFEEDKVQQQNMVVAVMGVSRLGGPFTAPLTGSGRNGQAGMIARLLQEHGLPPALTSVVAVESAFDPLALSPKGARGLWQLMPTTARRYGLKVEGGNDERTDLFKSTQAAASYIKDLYGQFQDWPLALAAYNAGEDRVARALARTGARDFWALRRTRSLPEETLQYVPAVLEKLEGPLNAPETERSASPAASGLSKSTGGHIAYATPASN